MGLGIASPRGCKAAGAIHVVSDARQRRAAADLEGFAYSAAAGGDTSAGGDEWSVAEV